ncbi:hypothetical protein ACH4F6_22000 [Streptomyces sp. NPDC017936]|uniref:hypothetical protein n=1 Tax=Streptomyces sp. NPDC017936 TaxID=3365016 RepID=UPI00379DC0A5
MGLIDEVVFLQRFDRGVRHRLVDAQCRRGFFHREKGLSSSPAIKPYVIRRQSLKEL